MKPSIKFLLMLSFVVSSAAYAQQQRVLAMSVATTTPTADTTEYGVPIIDSTTQFSTSMSIILAGTDSIYQVHIKLGSSLHGSEYLTTAFDYNVNGTFGNTSYSQTGNVIELGLGAHTGMISYFSEVQIEKFDHTFEEAVLFSNN